MCTPKDVLDPSVDGQISYLCGRHDCSLLHFGDPVIGTVYDDRILVSSGQWWPLPRGHTPGVRRGGARLFSRTPAEAAIALAMDLGAVVGGLSVAGRLREGLEVNSLRGTQGFQHG